MSDASDDCLFCRIVAGDVPSAQVDSTEFNVGEDAVNSVPHLHLHVMGGRRMGWPPG